MFDLDKFEQETAFNFEDAFDLEIVHPVTGEKTGLVVQVVSYRSERVKRVQRRLGNAAIRENKRNPKKTGTFEEIEERTNDIVAASIVGWNITKGGKPVPSTPEEIIKIISDPKYFFISEQVDKAADDDANFMTRPPKV